MVIVTNRQTRFSMSIARLKRVHREVHMQPGRRVEDLGSKLLTLFDRPGRRCGVR